MLFFMRIFVRVFPGATMLAAYDGISSAVSQESFK